MSPVIKTGVFVLSNISLTSVEDLEVYRSKVVAETDYFFSTYLRENFDALYNFKGTRRKNPMMSIYIKK